MNHARTKQIGWCAFLLLAVAAALAAWGYDTGSSSGRGRGLELAWHGLLALIGQEDVSGWRIWVARGLALAGLGLLAWFVVRRVRGRRPAGAAPAPFHPPQDGVPGPPWQPATEQPRLPEPQPQVRWSTDGPQPAPPVAPVLSWGAETSGPTVLPVLPTAPPSAASGAPVPPADATREVIIPPLPPGWARN
ncbi:hypothetical protein [Trujillonella endophytica]|uniref:Uncharacterized protein n=1 Tax=Trujillonella endophytica TaxID=673521 RepID=A0A1H8SA30_9ACTN|nr:hypothetical protein [Trujillella endophytica]SEO75580.1 hypothetical protein SAMN05660991_01550 [Trujillella endophytica]